MRLTNGFNAKVAGREPFVFLLLIAIALAWGQSGIASATDADDVSVIRTLWVDRLIAQLDHLPNESERTLIVVSLAAAEEIARAKELATTLSEQKRPEAIMGIADAQSSQGDLSGALETLSGLPAESQMAQYGRMSVAVRQAQRGNVAMAKQLIQGLTTQRSRDRVHSAIAQEYARIGDGESAKINADLIQDDILRRRAQKAIAAFQEEGAFSAAQVRSQFLASQIAALSLFSDDAPWKRAVFLTLGAAYRNDKDAVSREAERSISELKKLPEGVDRATGYALLTVAFSEVGDAEKADEAAQEARKAISGDVVGVSGLFGEPILIYAMIRIGHHECLDPLLSREQEGDTADRMLGSPAMEAVGAALIENHDHKRLDEIFGRMRNPSDRADLAIGVLFGLLDSPKTPKTPQEK